MSIRKKKMIKMAAAGSLCLLLYGCSKEPLFLQESESDTLLLQEEPLLESEVMAEVSEELPKSQERQKEEKEDDCEVRQIAVHVCGAVNRPGVYYLNPKQRVHEGIQKAGGFREDADSDYLNQALMLEDGMKIVVPTKEETQSLKEKGDFSVEEESLQIGIVSESEKTKGQKVDLNTADARQLCTLPGIGESRAESILAYRREYGLFKTIEDVMKVSGIKEAAFEKIKEYITVSE